jgi:cytoskeletal protein CcmA (bactofilin family)
VIGACRRIGGKIIEDGLHLDGEVTSDVVAGPGTPSVLAIGREGRVRGDLRAPRILVDGYQTRCATGA